MSGILALVAASPASELVRDLASVQSMLAALGVRGADARARWADPAGGVLLAVTRHAWETDGALAGPARVAVSARAAVVADASLYYRDALRAALRAAGVEPAGDDASALVLAAWEAWGSDAVSRLEGDFALLVWDRTRRMLVAARDLAGGRPLFYAETAAGLLAASTRAALVAHPACDAAYDLRTIAEAACGFAPGDGRTCYAGVRQVGAGETVRFADRRIVRERHWSAPEFERAGGSSFEDGARELRALLKRATLERMPEGARTTVWMSGGWDSTAVFGAGRSALAREPRGRELLPVSITYPEGDSGREDEYIDAVLDWWDAEGRWVRSEDVPFLADAAAAAARRDEPCAHPYEAFHRALARASVALDARVSFGGYGGDQLFYVSHVFFADLLRGGHLRTLRSAWREKGSLGAAHFWRNAVAPLVPDAAWRVARAVTGRALTPRLERAVPGWISPAFARRHDIGAAGRQRVARRRGEGFGSHETRFMIENPFFQRALGDLTANAAAAGVEMRSPLFDRRIIEFAATRPRWERSSGPDTKLLLRAAMRDLLPPGVLATRARRTGTSESYMRGASRRAYPALVAELSRDARLADLGIVEPRAWRDAANAALGGSGDAVVFLYFTLQTELWLRARERAPQVAGGVGAAAPLGQPHR